DLEPEHVQSIRFGVEAAVHERVTLAATAFHNDIEDHIRSVLAGNVHTRTELRDPPPLAPEQEELCERFGQALPICSRDPVAVPIFASLFVKQNLDRVRTRGVETRLRVRPHDRVDLEL